MNLKEIREIVDLITEKGIAEFELERSGTRLRISRQSAVRAVEAHPGVPIYAAAPALGPASAPPRSTLPEAASIAPPGASTAGAATGEVVVVRSPMVGTFYSAPGQDSPPFVDVGAHVRPGQILCIIEAMKLMNEIEAEMEGDVVKCYVENGQPVEFGEPLFDIRAMDSKRR